MTAVLHLELPESVLLRSSSSDEAIQRGKFLLALKYFELGEMSSGQAARWCGMPRADFLLAAGRLGVPVADLDPEEMKREFADE